VSAERSGQPVGRERVGAVDRSVASLVGRSSPPVATETMVNTMLVTAAANSLAVGLERCMAFVTMALIINVGPRFEVQRR
jgi:hypothetical protein